MDLNNLVSNGILSSMILLYPLDLKKILLVDVYILKLVKANLYL